MIGGSNWGRVVSDFAMLYFGILGNSARIQAVWVGLAISIRHVLVLFSVTV